MSTTSLLNSAIIKLTQRSDTNLPLVFNSDGALKQQKKLKQRVRDLYIEDLAFVVVGTFLQNVDLSILTDDELKVLLTFDYSGIDAKTRVRTYYPSINKTPYYDINNNIVNMPFKSINKINTLFKQLHSINKSLSIEYFISYIVSQI
jgi:hypothetical protein